MKGKNDNFISEIFYTADERFSFQKVGVYYNLYDRDSGYAFVESFRSFHAMQEYMIKEREKNGSN